MIYDVCLVLKSTWINSNASHHLLGRLHCVTDRYICLSCHEVMMRRGEESRKKTASPIGTRADIPKKVFSAYLQLEITVHVWLLVDFLLVEYFNIEVSFSRSPHFVCQRPFFFSLRTQTLQNENVIFHRIYSDRCLKFSPTSVRLSSSNANSLLWRWRSVHTASILPSSIFCPWHLTNEWVDNVHMWYDVIFACLPARSLARSLVRSLALILPSCNITTARTWRRMKAAQ